MGEQSVHGMDKWPGGTDLGILGGGVLPGSLNSDPITDQKKCHYSHPFLDLASQNHTHFQTWPEKNNVNIT